jgi:hypothetical protein
MGFLRKSDELTHGCQQALCQLAPRPKKISKRFQVLDSIHVLKVRVEV